MKCAFQANNTNGNITIGELDNALLITGLNGNLKAARVTTRSVFEDVNGNVDATFAKLTKGLALQDVNVTEVTVQPVTPSVTFTA